MFRYLSLFILLCVSPAQAQPLQVAPGSLYDLPSGFTDLGVWSLGSDDERLGGLSGLLLAPSGQLIALSDHGYLNYIDFGGPMFAPQGQLAQPQSIRIEALPLLSTHQPATHRRDAESLAYLDRGGDPRLYVSLERDHRVQRHFMDGRADQRLPKPIALQNTYGNTGIEALSGLPDTCLFAVTEGVQRQGGLRAFKYCGGSNWPTRVYRPSADGFVPTAADLSPDGQHVYLVERKFAGLNGFSARLVRLAVADIDADIPLIPELILDLSEHMLPTWNIEGLALTQDPVGNLIALMVTDSNYQIYLPNMLMALGLGAAGP